MKRPIALAILALSVCSAAGAVTRHVPQDYPTIQAAVDAAGAGDVIQVAAGTYDDVVHQPAGDTTKCVVVMKSGITVTGAGQSQTFIDARLRGRGFHCGATTNVTIQNLTVRNALANVYGAGVFCTGGANAVIQSTAFTNCLDGAVISLASTTTVTSCSFTNNRAKQGGAIAIEQNSTSTVTFCTMTGNASPSGGAMFVRASTLTMRFCTLTSNFINAANGSGGGAAIISAQATIRDSQFLNNTSDGIGGGLAIIDEAGVLLERCVIQGNNTTADYGPGGGVSCRDFSSLTMEDCTVTRNTVSGAASDGAGIFLFFADPVTINQCTIAANECDGQPTLGGGITCSFSSPTISKSIIAFNNPGKALQCDGGSMPVVSCSDLFGNAGGNTICGTDAGQNFSLDPLFCNLAGDNFRIAMNSPCYPGNHPNGANACQRDRIGGQDPGCVPAGVDDGEDAAVAAALTSRPNPFFPRTTLSFELPRSGPVRLAVYDAAGRFVRTLAEGTYAAGPHEKVWDGRDAQGRPLPSGVYFGRLEAGGVRNSRALVLTR
jgi:predicted outer membrane repeat protein